MPGLLGNKRIVGLVGLFLVIVFFLLVAIPSDSNVASYSKQWANKVQSSVSGGSNKVNETDDDFVFPTYEYTYDSLNAAASDTKEARDPCRDVSVNGRAVKNMPGMKVLVTGGGGFIGSNLVDRLLKEGYKVHILDNLYTGFIRNVPLGNPDVTFFHGDILDKDALAEAMEGCEFVYHLAAMSKVVPSLKSPAMARFCTESNALGSWNVLDVAREAKVKKVVYAASSTYYGNHPAPHREDMAPDFLTPYAASKYEGEIQMQMFDTLFNVPTISTRFFMVYGPRQPSTGAYAIVTGVFAKEAADGVSLTIEGDGTHYRDFIHVEDIVEGLMLAQQDEGLHGDVINLGSGLSYSVQDVADLVSSDQVYVDPRKNDLEGTLANTCKQKQKLGHVAKKDFTTEMSFMVKETQKGNVFPQKWLQAGHSLAVPHIRAKGTPMFLWPKDQTNLGALLLSIEGLRERVEARKTSEASPLKAKQITLFLLNKVGADEGRYFSQLMMNTVYSVVRYGGASAFMVAASDEQAFNMCNELNMPCYDARMSTTPSILSTLVQQGYDVHLAEIGNSYISSVESWFSQLSNDHSGADIIGAQPSGDIFIKSNDKTRSALAQWASTASDPDMSNIHSLSSWPDLSVTKTTFNVERYCPDTGSSSTFSSSANSNETSAFSKRADCGQQLYVSVGCSDDYQLALKDASQTIEALKQSKTFHFTQCMDLLHCDIQQLIPRYWVQQPPELTEFGGLC